MSERNYQVFFKVLPMAFQKDKREQPTFTYQSILVNIYKVINHKYSFGLNSEYLKGPIEIIVNLL